MNTFYRVAAYVAIGASSLYTPSADAGILKEIGKRVVGTIKEVGEVGLETVFITPVRVVRGGVNFVKGDRDSEKDQDPMDGARRIAGNDLESVFYEFPKALIFGETTDRSIEENGKLNTKIEESQGTRAIANITTGFGLIRGITEAAGSSVLHANQAGGYTAAGQAVVEGVKTYDKK
ncbi:hypothetical protein HYW74_05075 [Candidatus Pacearchaeota archaeon]|nr:hypothetical protein [Candidatus Pacearchaeota archaeon]